MKKIMMWALYVFFGALVLAAVINAGRQSHNCGQEHSFKEVERYAGK